MNKIIITALCVILSAFFVISCEKDKSQANEDAIISTPSQDPSGEDAGSTDSEQVPEQGQDGDESVILPGVYPATINASVEDTKLSISGVKLSWSAGDVIACCEYNHSSAEPYTGSDVYTSLTQGTDSLTEPFHTQEQPPAI